MGLLLENKNILIMGVRNKWSIAWGIAKAAHEEGAKVIFTYMGEREREGVLELAENLGKPLIYPCNIALDEEIDSLFDQLKKDHGEINGLVHAIAHAKSEDMHNDFINTTREGFAHAMDVSAYSLVAVCRRARDIMPEGSSIITLTYMGSEKVLPGYNVMGVAKAALEASVRYLANDLGQTGIRMNAISAGPIKTLSAKGVKDFGNILDVVETKAPLRRRINQQDLGNAALYFLSRLSSGVTGEITYVDCGYNIMGI